MTLALFRTNKVNRPLFPGDFFHRERLTYQTKVIKLNCFPDYVELSALFPVEEFN